MKLKNGIPRNVRGKEVRIGVLHKVSDAETVKTVLQHYGTYLTGIRTVKSPLKRGEKITVYASGVGINPVRVREITKAKGIKIYK